MDRSSIIAFPTIINDHAWHDIAVVRGDDYDVAIGAAETPHLRSCASRLINRMYGWQGYGTGFSVEDGRQKLSLLAIDRRTRHAVGTLTVALDGREGLLADQMYGDQTSRLRNAGCRLCEIVKFAIDPSLRSRRVLSGLFHVAFLYGYRVHDRSDLLIEVTPQHAVFYRHMLHFKEAGEVKLNARVQTYGQLLRLDLAYASELIRLVRAEPLAAPRTFYSTAFAAAYENQICERLSRREAQLFGKTQAGMFAAGMA